MPLAKSDMRSLCAEVPWAHKLDSECRYALCIGPSSLCPANCGVSCAGCLLRVWSCSEGLTMLRFATRHRRFGFEQLERREVLAGNVTAVIDGGNLVITGDSGNNNIVISRGPLGQVIVAGGTEGGAIGTETQINGSVAPAILSGFAVDVLINMGDGNDRVVITDFTSSNVINAYLGGGDDVFLLQSRSEPALPFTRNDAAPVTYADVSTIGSVIVYANSGNDTFGMFDASIGGDLIFYGDVGNDTFIADGTTTADAVVQRAVLVDMGFGDDIFTAERISVRDGFTLFDGGATVGSTVTLTSLNVDRDVRMYLSIGADNVVIRGEDNGANRFFADDLVVFTGHTADTVTIENALVTNLTLDTGAGDEGNGFFGIELRNLAVTDTLWVNSGEGFDNILLEDSSAGVIRLFSGAGSDGVIARNLNAVDAVFDAGDELDIFGLYDSDYERLVVGMYAGDDLLYLGSVRVTRAATFDGGDDDDTFRDRDDNDFQASNQVSIENVEEA